MVSLNLVVGQKYNYTDTFGMVLHNDAEFLGRVYCGPYYDHKYYYVMKSQREQDGTDFYCACYLKIDDNFGYSGNINIYLQGSNYYGDSLEEVLEKIRGPKLELL